MSDPVTRLNAALQGRYRIGREVGEGGMATVYLADDLRHERKVALKVLKPELAAVVGAERFLAEIKTTANLHHPHVLPLHDSGEADGFAPGVTRFSIAPAEEAAMTFGGLLPDLAISRDGRLVVYTGDGSQLNLRFMDQLTGAPLRGGADAVGPFFSPGGDRIGFVQDTFGHRILKKVSALGGPSVTLTESPATMIGATWGPGDEIVFGTSTGGLFRVSGGGGEPLAVTTLDAEAGEQRRLWPSFIDGRRAVVFVAHGGGDLSNGALSVVDLETGRVKRLGVAGSSPQYVSTGHLVYAAQDASARAVPFDAASLEVTGSSVPLVEGVMVKVSGAGELQRLGRRLLDLRDRDGVGALGEPALGAGLGRPSRQGGAAPDRSATVRVPQSLTRGSADRSQRRQGSRARSLGLRCDLGRRPPPHPGRRAQPGPHVVTTSDESQALTGITPDGATMTYTRVATEHWEVMGTATDGSGDATPLVAGPFRQGTGDVPPDGRWLAYRSDVTGAFETYVQPFPGAGAKVPVSTGAPWARSGRSTAARSSTPIPTAR